MPFHGVGFLRLLPFAAPPSFHGCGYLTLSALLFSSALLRASAIVSGGSWYLCRGGAIVVDVRHGWKRADARDLGMSSLLSFPVFALAFLGFDRWPPHRLLARRQPFSSTVSTVLTSLSPQSCSLLLSTCFSFLFSDSLASWAARPCSPELLYLALLRWLLSSCSAHIWGRYD